MAKSQPDSSPALKEEESEVRKKKSGARNEGGRGEKTGCSLCGLPVGRSGISDVFSDQKLHFCCPGCLNVFRILFNSPEGPPEDYRKTGLYRACVASGLIPGNNNDLRPSPDEADPTPPAPSQNAQNFDQELSQELSIKIEGMWCTACSWLIEKVLGSVSGILEARVIFLSDLAKIKYQPHVIDPEEILERICGLGYRASLFDSRPEASQAKRDLLLRLGIASILTINVMMISFALYGGFFEDLGKDGVRSFSYPLLLLATPVIFYAGFPILKRAWLGLRHASTSMDTLISVGTLSAYFYSIVQMRSQSLHLYFDTASMLVTLVLLGKFIEIQAREKVSRGILELFELARSKVRLAKGGLERWVCSEGVEPGLEFLVESGERVPVDGRIISGRASLDESILTGESRPVKKAAGEEVSGGSLVLDGFLHLSATRRGSESFISQMVSLMQEALTRKNPVELLADRITRRLVPAILMLSALTASFLIVRGSVSVDEALLRAVTVLVITCPCALGIATPLAKVASIGIGRSRGLLVRDPAALERAKDLDVILFDKTGTLTEGNFCLRQTVAEEGVDPEEALLRVAVVEACSDHFLARDIVRKVNEKGPVFLNSVEGYESFEGLGVKGRVGGADVAAGNRRFMHGQGFEISDSMDKRAESFESEGSTLVFFAWEGRVRGFFAFGDSIKKSAPDAISRLHEKGISTWLVSGDSPATTSAVARELGIGRFRGGALPKDKLELVKKLRKEGRCVGVVGDGINDAPALAGADIGFALGTGTDLIRKASDITLLCGDPGRIVELLDLSALTTRIIRQNLFFAFIYNILGIPLAVLGLLNPMVAVFAMFASSLTVIGNTLRISRARIGAAGAVSSEQ